ncbi:hypothetical protein ASE00_09950 [Sphingomonas sp. Root710]|uniref:hypothetical protein n=1 Tax=Sphingomonas sp. Root710 TaxID=1736594 RepID=UPI0006F7164F|nr:hypothetical protein [Sphingomonas sp. Root710]KRB82381.1 hypothetical protein ASE00_09950 [Sphingomonas sp. Root710]
MQTERLKTSRYDMLIAVFSAVPLAAQARPTNLVALETCTTVRATVAPTPMRGRRNSRNAGLVKTAA